MPRWSEGGSFVWLVVGDPVKGVANVYMWLSAVRNTFEKGKLKG